MADRRFSNNASSHLQVKPALAESSRNWYVFRALIRSLLIDMQAVFDVDFTNGLTLIEIADGVTVDEVKAKTEAPFVVSDDLKPMQI